MVCRLSLYDMVCRMDALSGGTSSLQNEARKLNHAEVVEEDRRNKLPANWEARKRKAEWEAMEEEARKVEMALVHLLSIVLCERRIHPVLLH